MTGDIHDIVNRVVSEAQQDRRQKMIESCISSCRQSIQVYTSIALSAEIENIPDQQVKQEMRYWSCINSHEVAYKLKEALGIILRQELLGEQ